MKKTSSNVLFNLVLIFALTISLFTSCDNFLKAQDAKNDIISAIDYNNAPSYTIYFQALKGSGTIKNVQGDQLTKKVSDTFTIRFEPEDDHVFIKWEAIIPEIAAGESPSDYIAFDDEKSLETKVTFKKAAKNIVIRPVCPERLSVTKFNLNDEGQIYSRDSSIVITFNAAIPQACKDAVAISVPGLPEGKTSADYFLPGEVSGKEITIRTKYSQTHLEEDLIPVKGSIPIHVTIPAKSIYYVNQEYLEDVSIYNDKDISFNYTINSETSKKTQIRFHIDNAFVDYSTMRVNDDLYTEHPEKYSVGTTLNLSYKISDDYQFYGWKLTRSNPDSEEDVPVEYLLPDNADTLSEINLSVTYKEDNLLQPVFTINNFLDGLITIEPNVSRIPEAYINIDGEHGTFTPGKGMTRIKQGTANHIEFDPASDYAFIRWKVINEKTKQEIQLASTDGNGNKTDTIYIQFDNVNSSKTDYNLMQVPNSEEVSILIEPELVERPRVISNSPSYQSSGVLRDSTIQVMFDFNMDENSIYFSNNDKTLITLDEDNGDEWLYVEENNPNSKCYGYIKDGKKYFKNISITNSRTDENLNGNFKAPVFENSRTLAIPVDRSHPIDPGVRVSVTLGEGFYYRTNNTDIFMSRAEKWQYLVNGKIDDQKPDVDKVIIKDSNGGELESKLSYTFDSTNLNSLNFFANGKFELFLSATDTTAPDSTFNIVCKKLYDKNYTPVTNSSSETIMVEYNNPLGTTSEYGYSTSSQGNTTYTTSTCYLDDLDDGIYSLYFEIKDGSGNKAIYPPNTGTEEDPVYEKYYFCMDKTAPEIAKPTIDYPTTSNDTIKLTWKTNSIDDYKDTIVSYKKWGDTNYTDSPSCNTSCLLQNLVPGTLYSIIARHYDYAGNFTENIFVDGVYTRPDIPQKVVINSVDDSKIELICTKPDSENFTSFDIYSDDIDAGMIDTVVTDTGSIITISKLEKGVKYQFEVASYDAQNDIYSLPYTVEGELPSFTTKPNSPKDPSVTFNTYTNKGEVEWRRPANGVNGYYIYCSTDQEIPEDDDSVTQTFITPDPSITSHLFQNLTPGTKYYVKAVSYYESTDNKSEPVCFTTNTQCAPVTNFTAAAESNTVINLSWTAPTGEYDSYTVTCKPHSVSSWTGTQVKSQTVNKTNTTARIESLTGATDYDIKIVVNGITDSTEQLIESCKTCPNPASNVYAQKNSDTSFTVTWNAPEGNFDGYKIYYSQTQAGLNSNPSFVSVNKTKTQEKITGLTSKALYYIKIETYIDSTLKTYTSQIACSLALDNVRNLTAQALSETSIKLTWTNPTESFDGIKVYKGNQLLTDTPLSNTTTSYTISTGLSANTSYDFKVNTYKTESGELISAEAPVSAYTYSSPIQSVSATINTPTSVTFNWTYPPRSAYNQVNLYRNNETTRFDYWSTATQGTYNIFEGGTQYTIKFLTTNNAGIVNPTVNSSNTITLITPPKPVSSLTCTSTTQTKAVLSWSKPSGNYTGVNIYYKLHGATNWISAGSVSNNTSTTYTVENLTAGSSYDFMVETYLTGTSNVGSTSQASLSSQNTKPNAPTNFSLSPRDTTSLTVKWTKPTGSFTGYTLYYKTSSSSSWSSKTPSSTDTSYTISNLTQGTSYDVKLCSYYSDADNESVTNTISKATKPGKPTGFKVQEVNGETKLSWTKPSTGSVTKYKVYYRTGSTDFSTQETTNTYYTFSNTSLTNGYQYEFYVKTIYAANSETLESAQTTTEYFWTPPASLNVSPTIYCDDAMGTIVLRWQNPTNRPDIQGINIYVDDSTTWSTYLSSYTTGYVTATVTIPNYIRGSTHTFKIQPYHKKNGTSTEVRGPKKSTSLTTSSGNLKINGSTIESSSLTRVLSSNTTITNHPGDGGSFVDGRNITLTKYSIGTYEVTNYLWATVTGSGTYNYKPKVNINWMQAIAFCNKLSAIQGLEPCYEISGYENVDWKNFNMNNVPTSSSDPKYSNWYGCKQNLKKNGYHLPTCAQWELAARGGNPSQGYFTQAVSGVYDWAVMSSYVVYNTTSSAIVGSKYSNELGLYDMCGNVWEMLTDWNNLWPAGNFTDPYCEVRYHGTGTGEWVNNVGDAIPYNLSNITLYRAGGCYLDTAGLTTGDTNYNLRVYATYPGYFYASSADSYTGFRLCRNVTYKTN